MLKLLLNYSRYQLSRDNQYLSFMPKRQRPSPRVSTVSRAKRAKLHTAPFSLSNKFEFRPDPSMTGTSTLLPTPDKSKTDKKDYRTIRLSNGLTVLLISDASYPLDKLDEEEALLAEEEGEGEAEDGDEGDEESDEDDLEEEEDEDDDDEEEGEEDEERPSNRLNNTTTTGLKMSAASLCVHIGSFSDPEDVPGMAHFLEHMVFMGTEKYPDENSFDAFNRKHGGFDNASTDCETTIFYFEIPRKNFVEGMDRFAQFFISPLMKMDSMQREREAVDSEFQMALPSDYNRIAQIYGGIAEGHPMAKFMWGNTKSLTPGLSDEEMHKRLHEFRVRHYSAQFMSLAVQSQHTLDSMQEWVENIFSSIPNNGLELETFHHLDKPFDNPRFHKLYRLHPVQNIYQIDLFWSLQSLLDKYRTKPLHYMSWIIGHEGKGSLLSYLRKKVWALSLTAGCQGDGFEYNSSCSMFSISIVLTKSGYDAVDEVLKAVFGYLHMMQSQAPSQRIYKEIQEIERLDFAYSEEKQPSENVETLSENMHFFPPERYLDGDDLMFEYDEVLIRRCTNHLEFENVSLFLKSRDIPEEQLDKKEPWFETKYSEIEIPEAWAAACKDKSLSKEFHLPEPNPFIAEDLAIREADLEPSKYPIRIVEDDVGELFYKKDILFLQPRGYIYYKIRSPLPLLSLENSVLLDLMANSVLQLMIEDVYPADLAQLYYALYSAETGLVIKVSGLSDKLPKFLVMILNHLVKMADNIQPSLFNAVREQTRKDYFNHSIKPKKLVRDVRLTVLQDVYWSPYEKHNVVRNCTIEELQSFTRKFLGQGFLQGLIQGNFTSAEAKHIDGLVRSTLPLKSLNREDVTEIRCNQLIQGSHLLQVAGFNKEDTNTLVTNYYQAGPGGVREHAILELVMMLMEEPVFDTLRTQEQLGYSVFNTLRNTYGVLGFSVTVNTQATKYTSEHVEERIESFLKMFVSTHVNEEKVAFTASSLAKLKVRADVTLEEEVGRHWGEITSKEYNFSRAEKEVMALSKISFEEVLDYFKPLLFDSSTCRKLSVHVIGHKEKLEAKESEDRTFSLSVFKDKENSVSDIVEFKQKLETHPVLYIID